MTLTLLRLIKEIKVDWLAVTFVDTRNVTGYDQSADAMFMDVPVTHTGLFHYDMGSPPFDTGN